MSKQHPWLFAGTAALAIVLSQGALLAEEPPQAEQVEIEITESVQQVAEQAAEAAQAIAAEAAAKAQEAAGHAQQAAEEVVERVNKAAGELNINFSSSPPYQLGLHVSQVPKALDAQLKLEGKGILIDSVEKDGAGEQAGVKPHDIVISVAGKDIKSSADLVKLIRNSKGKALKFDLLRGGEKLSISVQPENVLTLNNVDVVKLPKIEFDEEIIELEHKIREKLKGAGVDVRMHVIRPGQVMASDVMLRRAELPEGVSISVRRESGKPAKVEVSRGEEKWELTEGEFDKLPEDLRPHVDRMLGKFTAPLPPGAVVSKKAPVAERHQAAKMKVERAATEYQLEVITRSLQEIKKDIHRIYDQIDELRDDHKKD